MAVNIFSCACGRQVLITRSLPTVGGESFCSFNCSLFQAAKERKSVRARREAEREASADFGRAAAAEGRKPDGDRARREAERRSRQLARSGPKGGMAFPSGKKSGKKSR